VSAKTSAADFARCVTAGKCIAAIDIEQHRASGRMDIRPSTLIRQRFARILDEGCGGGLDPDQSVLGM